MPMAFVFDAKKIISSKRIVCNNLNSDIKFIRKVKSNFDNAVV